MATMKLVQKGTRKNAAPAKPKAPVNPMSRKEQVKQLLSQMDSSLEEKAKKASVADFIRLTQLERELEENEPVRKVVVTWKEAPSAKLNGT